MKQEEIKKIIPHRDPFLFIDEIIELDLEQQRAVGLKTFPKEAYFYEGHFPSQPVTPGVIILESLAQVGAVILLSSPAFKGKLAMFTGIKSAKFRKMVLPGDTIRLECQLTKIKGPFGFGDANAYVGNQLVCEAEFSFAIT